NKPESWNIIEVDLGVLGIYYSAEQTTDAAFGSYAVKLETQSILGQQDMPGYVALGEFDLTTFMPSGGIPFNSRPTALKFSYKYAPQPNDSMFVFVLLTKWNTADQQRDTIGGTMYSSSEEITDYTLTELPIFYQSVELPDTINVGFVSSASTPVPGSTMFVDSVEMNYDLAVYPTVALPASNVSSNFFTASWMPIAYCTGYILDVAFDSNFSDYLPGYEHLTLSDSPFETTHNVVLLEPSKYYYRIKVIYGQEESVYSNIVSVAMPTEAEEATEIGPTGFRANWFNVSNADLYLLDVCLGTDFNNLVPGYSELPVGIESSYLISGLDGSQEYSYRLKTIYGNDTSIVSNVISTETTATAINNVQEPELRLSVKNETVSVYVNNIFLPAILRVYNISGKLITERPLNSETETVIFSHSGIYIFELKTETKTFRKKVLLN
ncbi:MAG: T9SS type A sorting domain-containing protein, partial [Bacteroidota bacterium]|nr:T9SS type A sorting domain-containing protein [Bacteroidota bacterium]